MEPLRRTFFADDADRVAARLLGHLLVHETRAGPLVGRIVETEAYFGPPHMNRHLARRRDTEPWIRDVLAHGDPAAHSFRGPTPRNAIMFGPPGRAYVYLVYGANECLNVSTGPAGDAQAVLLRALEPVRGLDAMRARRGPVPDRDLARGPGRLAAALGVTRAANGHDMTTPPLYFARGRRTGDVARGPRVGITKAAELPLRFWIEGSAYASRGPRG